MDFILKIFGFISGLGPSVMMPIIFVVLGLILKAGPGKSIRAGLTVGVGFIGINLVVGLMGGELGPAVQTMSERFGLSLSIIDVGWPAAAAIAFASTVGTIIIPVCLLVNIVMLLTNTTQTINIDIWNYWHFAFTGGVTAVLTGSQALGVFAAILNMVITMVMGDVTAPSFEEVSGLPGISLPHGFTVAFVPVALIVNKIIDVIPGLNKVDLDMVKIQKRYGVFGEPILVGSVLGVIIGILAGYDVAGFLGLGISMGAVLVLIPKMAAMLMEGLLPISDAASAFIEGRFKSRAKIYIGLDSAVGIGHPTTLAVSLLLVPISIFLAVILPGNQVLPFTDLAVIPFIFVLIIPIVKNNGFRALVIGIVTMASGLYIATNMAPLITQSAAAVGFALPEGATLISSICDGANALTWGIVRLHGLGIVGIVICTVITVGLAVWNRFRIVKEAKAIRSSGESE